MAEPISKKSDAYYRKARESKIEREKDVLSKIKPLKSFFQTIDNCNVRKEPSSEHSKLNSTITVFQVDPNIDLHETETRIGICKKNRSENKQFNQGHFVLAINNNAPDTSSRTDKIDLEVNGIAAIVPNDQNPINRTGNIPVHVDRSGNSKGTEYN